MRKTLNPTMAQVLKRLHYPLDVILTRGRWHVAYPLSLRHLEEMMADQKPQHLRIWHGLGLRLRG
jgi:putative transposase